MTVKKKKIGAAGKFGAGYGRPKIKFSEIEKKQRVKQVCPFCKGRAKRVSSGIWECQKCEKKFAGGTYYLKS